MTIDKLPKPLMDNYEWQYEGECNNHDPELFFLPDRIRFEKKREYIKKAKAICAACPVIEQCRDYALTTQQEFGVWGGLSEEERRVVFRKGVRLGTL